MFGETFLTCDSVLYCYSSPLNYRWFRDGKEMPRRATFSETRRVMTISNVQIEDGGQYRCRVDGRRTSQFDEKNYTLDVQCVYNKECVCIECVCISVCVQMIVSSSVCGTCLHE